MNQPLQFEFDVPLARLKHICPKKSHEELQGEPRLRQSLILAYQIGQIIADGQVKDFAQTAQWLNMTKARLSQIMGLINLAPTIQEEILLTDSPKIRKVSVQQTLPITAESDWDRQMTLWKALSLPLI